MNKTKFLKLCETALDASRLSIGVRRAGRELYPCVFLNGEWGKDFENVYHTHATLFTPQCHKDHFMTWHATCETKAVKFCRWLDKFQGV